MAQLKVQTKAFEFALQTIEAYKHLTNVKKEYVLSKQLLRAATSIGANIEEGIGCNSKAEFAYKMSISYRESRETKYWLKLLLHANYLNRSLFDALYDKCDELARMLFKLSRKPEKPL